MADNENKKNRILVFLSHSRRDKPSVERIAERLVEVPGILPWLDKWNLIPGDPWQEALEDALELCDVCLVFLGPGELSPWQNEEMRDVINQRVSDPDKIFRVIPVLLPGAQKGRRGELPRFLLRVNWVEFRESVEEEEAFNRLLAGIRGVPPGRGLRPLSEQFQNPYRGLFYFDVEHAPYFFGRDAEVNSLLDVLRQAKSSNTPNRFLALIGASGSGKSSLARAGLLATLEEGKEIAGSKSWQKIIFVPGADPLNELADAFAEKQLFPGLKAAREFVEDARGNERALTRALRMYTLREIRL